ncbi:MAG: hypothetical protein ACRD43_08100, partial [Pyrinomonadaceae bacterium]
RKSIVELPNGTRRTIWRLGLAGLKILLKRPGIPFGDSSPEAHVDGLCLLTHFDFTSEQADTEGIIEAATLMSSNKPADTWRAKENPAAARLP